MIAQIGGEAPHWTPWLASGIVGVSILAAVALVSRHQQPLLGWGGTEILVVDSSQPEPASLRRLATALTWLIAGYLFFDRGFAWLHVPGTPLFVGESVIIAGVVTLMMVSTQLGRIVRSSGSLQFLVGYMAWGAVLLAIALPRWGLDALRDSALWYYGIVALFVAILVISRPQRVVEWPQLFGRAIPALLLWYPMVTLVQDLFPSSPLVPDSQVPLTAHRAGNMAVLAALAIAYLWIVDRDHELFTTQQRAALTALGIFVILLNGVQNRGGLVAAAVAFLLLAVVTQRVRLDIFVISTGIITLLVSFALVFDLKIDLLGSRDFSVDQLLRNVVTVVDSEAAGGSQSGTVRWRLRIWSDVVEDVTAEKPLTGFGPGPDLGRRYDITQAFDIRLRNPHNSHIGVLGRMGWVGVMLWVGVWVSWALEMALLRRRLTRAGRPREARLAGWLIVFAVPILVNAIFDPTLEGPQVAVVLWAFFGLGSALVILERAGLLPSSIGPPSARAALR